MNKWHLQMDKNTERAIRRATIRHPHLSSLIERALEELLNFPPERWFKVKVEGTSITFTPETGQKVRFWGKAFVAEKAIYIAGFTIHE